MLSRALICLYHERICSNDCETRSLGIGDVFETKPARSSSVRAKGGPCRVLRRGLGLCLC